MKFSQKDSGCKVSRPCLCICAADDFAKAVSEGYRPERTRVFTDDLWKLVCGCWDQDPVTRPNMSFIVARLEGIITEVRQLRLMGDYH